MSLTLKRSWEQLGVILGAFSIILGEGGILMLSDSFVSVIGKEGCPDLGLKYLPL